MDPISAIGATVTAAQAASQVSQGIDSVMKQLRAGDPDLKSLTIDYPSQSSLMKIRLKPSNSWRNPFSKIEIPLAHGYEVTGIIDSGFNTIQVDGEVKDGKWVAPAKHFAKGESYLFELRGTVDQSVIDRFVEVRAPENPTKRQTEDSYWLHSALKDPGALEQIYSDLNIDRLSMNVGVGVERSFSTAIPKAAEELLRAKQDFNTALRQKQRNLRHVQHSLYSAEQKAGKITVDRIYELITRLSSKDGIQDFIEVSKSFDVGNINPVRDLHLFPSSVDVSVAASLSLRTPVLQGDLVFQKTAFREDVKAQLENAIEEP